MIKIYHDPDYLLSQLNKIKHIQLPAKTKSIYETVLIEFEPLPYIEYTLRYTILQFPTWSHTVVCSLKNVELIKSWHLPIHIITLQPFDNNNMFMQPSFWYMFEGIKLLFYHKHSVILHNNIHNLLEYDFIISTDVNLSFRTKSCMIQSLQTKSKLITNKQVVHEIISNQLNCIPEYIYFLTVMETFSIGTIAPPGISLLYNSPPREKYPICKLKRHAYSDHPEYIDHPQLFHKYILSIACPTDKIPYTITKEHTSMNQFICHLHILNLDLFEDIYGEYIQNLMLEYKIVVTYVDSTNSIHYPVTLIQIKNKGFDIGGKLCCLQYLKDKQYDYILFLHSKTDPHKRKQYFSPLVKNRYRMKLCKTIIKHKNIAGIFPNVMWHDCNSTNNVFINNNLYYTELCKYLKIQPMYCFSEGNCFLCSKEVVDTIFTDYTFFYNLLNEPTSFDYNWLSIVLKDTSSIKELYEKFDPAIHNLNTINLRDAMIEHVFERMWIDVILHLNKNYLVLDEKNIIDMYKIKINAIYFPQYHEMEENNKFWGKGFTEWTILKPFDSTMVIDNVSYNTLKPHEDIGYYTLTADTLQRQISMATQYNINGFIIYHYWFQINHKVMYKPLEYFLNTTITFPFAISWANETWSKNWDGSNKDILIEQTYEPISFFLHIQYLIPFFKRPNYIKNDKGECIFYIYKMNDIPNLAHMVYIWETELKKHHLTIKLICTEGSSSDTHGRYPNNFIFEPMYSTIYTQLHYLQTYINLDYKNIIHNYKTNTYTLTNKHLGLPLYWNNKVRRKKSLALNVKNFNMDALEELLLLLIAELVVKYKNISDLNQLPSHENFININAWNEWNEQAVLEPNEVTGYENIRTISSIIGNL